MSSTHLNIPRPLTASVQQLALLVEKFRELDDVVLSLDLGSESGSGRWVRGVNEFVFMDILDMLTSYNKWEEVSEWEDMHEYTYTLAGEHVITNVHICNNVEVSHVTKIIASSLDMQLLNHGRARATVECTASVDKKNIPDAVTPTRVCLKKRKTFRVNAWSFTLEREWSGSNRTDAELAQSKGGTVFGISVAFQPNEDYWLNQRHTSTYVATSMLMKMVDILSPEMICVTPVAV